MSVQNNTELITFQKWTLRVRPARKKTPRLLLLLHGWTGDENSLWVFVRNFPEDYWIVAPRAPYILKTLMEVILGGRYKLGFLITRRGRLSPTLERLRPAAETLIPLIDSYPPENNIQASQFDLIGFSQGGVLANTISILHPERTCRAAILPALSHQDAESILQESTLKGKAFFVAHGTLDETVRSNMRAGLLKCWKGPVRR